jgi:hypothetical protein
LASNSTVMVRERSTCVLRYADVLAGDTIAGTWRSDSDRMLMPSASQMCL